MPGLSDRHKTWLRDDSGIDCDLAESLGWRSAEAGEIGVIVGFNVDSPGIVIPYPNVPGFERVRLDHPHVFPGETITDSDGKQRKGKDRFAKYLSPKNTSTHAYITPQVTETLKDPSARIAITEGEKKALAAIQRGLPCIGLAGVWGWIGKSAPRLVGENKVAETDTLAELADTPWMGREVWLFFDSDALINDQVLGAGRRLKEELRRRGARARLVVFQEEGGHKVGLDDYFHAGHSTDDLWEYSKTAVVSDAQRDFDIDQIEILKTSPRKISVRLNWGDGVLIEGLEVADIAVWNRFRLAVFNQTSRFPKFKPVKGGSTWDDFIGDAVDMVGMEIDAPEGANPEAILWEQIAWYLQNRSTSDPKDLIETGRPYENGKYVYFKVGPMMDGLNRRHHLDLKSGTVWDVLRKRGAFSTTKRLAGDTKSRWWPRIPKQALDGAAVELSDNDDEPEEED